MQMRKERQNTNADHAHASVWGVFLLMPALIIALHLLGMIEPVNTAKTSTITESE